MASSFSSSESTFLKDLALSTDEYQQFVKLAYEKAGIDLHEGKQELIQARMGKVLRRRGYSTYQAYLDYVATDKTGDAIVEMLNALTTNLTYFFREPQHFEFLQNTVVPHLLSQARQSSNYRIRGWSAGCSSGEEPYSIVITLLEALQGDVRWDMRVLATDLSTKVLDKAEQGVYEMERVESIEYDLKRKYFQKGTGDQSNYARVRDAVREYLLFRRLNLMDAFPFKNPFDFIFCRNVMIYFDRPTQERLISKYYDSLFPGGHLFIGHSETLTGIRHRFEYVQPTIYRKPLAP